MTNPLVSVMLCTHNSRKFLPMVLESFKSQDYTNLELVVVDDGDDSIDDLLVEIPHTYLWHPAKNLSQKRNFGIRNSQGAFIVHFDSDDWSGPERVSHQVSCLIEKNIKMVGYSWAFWYDTRKKITSYANTQLWGASLCYDRKWALSNQWNEKITQCEDHWFMQAAWKKNQIAEMEGGENFVALNHNGNAQRPFGTPGWEIIANDKLPSGFRAAMQLG